MKDNNRQALSRMARIENNARWLLSAIVLSAMLTSCSKSPEQVDVLGAIAIPVQVTNVVPSDWVRSLYLYGKLQSAEEIKISTDVQATVKQVHFKEGERVNAGDLLLSLDDRKLKLALDQASAQVTETGAELERLQAELARNEQLHSKGVISKQTFQRKRLTNPTLANL